VHWESQEQKEQCLIDLYQDPTEIQRISSRVS